MRLILLQGHQGHSVENESVVKAGTSHGRLRAPGERPCVPQRAPAARAPEVGSGDLDAT